MGSAAGDNFHDLQTIAGVDLALREFGGRHGFAIQFHDDAAREQALGGEEFFQRAGQSGGDFVPVGDDGGGAHSERVLQAGLRTMMMLRSTAVS